MLTTNDRQTFALCVALATFVRSALDSLTRRAPVTTERSTYGIMEALPVAVPMATLLPVALRLADDAETMATVLAPYCCAGKTVKPVRKATQRKGKAAAQGIEVGYVKVCEPKLTVAGCMALKMPELRKLAAGHNVKGNSKASIVEQLRAKGIVA